METLAKMLAIGDNPSKPVKSTFPLKARQTLAKWQRLRIKHSPSRQYIYWRVFLATFLNGRPIVIGNKTGELFTRLRGDI